MKDAPKKKLAIVGSGIAGVATAYFLKDHYDITLFEKNDKLGGHIDTHQVEVDGTTIPIDTGFIMFNERKYPTFITFLKTLNIPYGKSKMSFGIQNDSTNTYVSGQSFYFALLRSKSVFTKDFWRLIKDMHRFRKITLTQPEHLDAAITVADYLESHNFSRVFNEEYLLVVFAGLMSQSMEGIKKYPVRRIINFLRNHGLLCPLSHYPWLYVKQGYDRYVHQALKQTNASIRLNTPVKSVRRSEQVVYLKTDDGEEVFDNIVIACEADIALKILENPTPKEKQILRAFRYNKNDGLLHTDTSVMPTDKPWAAQTVHLDAKKENGCFTIWLNPMLGLPTEKPFFTTLNPSMKIAEDKIVKPVSYRHLQLSRKVLEQQTHLPELNDTGPVYFVGSYFKYFHEDGMTSAKSVSQKLISKA